MLSWRRGRFLLKEEAAVRSEALEKMEPSLEEKKFL